MKRFHVPRLAMAALLAIVSSLIIWACTAPVRVTTSVTAFGTTLSCTVDSQGNATNAFTGALPPGQCLKIEYRDSDGELLKTDVVHVPGSSKIPAGAVSESFNTVQCPNDDGNVHSTASGLGAHQVLPAPMWIDICGWPIVPDVNDGGVFKNAIYHFRVKAQAGVDPFSRIEPILRGGPGTPVPADVIVDSFTQMIPELFGARMIVADTASFEQFRLDWNGQQGYADLATGTNVLQYELPNQWRVIESIIDVQDIQALPGEINHGVTVRKTVSDAAPDTVDASLTVLSF
jgi:hypothetical protein